MPLHVLAPDNNSPEIQPLLNLPPLARLLVQIGLTLAQWDLHHRTRSALHHLDPHLLRDIGLSQDKRATECAKPFWQA